MEQILHIMLASLSFNGLCYLMVSAVMRKKPKWTNFLKVYGGMLIVEFAAYFFAHTIESTYLLTLSAIASYIVIKKEGGHV